MNVMGITSSLIDVLAFLGFWFLFGYNASKETFFQTAWFVECLISETMIIHYVRTAKRPFIESRANKWLTLGTFGTIIGTILTPILLHNIPSFHFEILPLKYYGNTTVGNIFSVSRNNKENIHKEKWGMAIKFIVKSSCNKILVMVL